MKYLLIFFLLSFNLYAVCGSGSVEEINFCTIEDFHFETQEELAEWKSSQLASLAEKKRRAAIKLRIEAIGGKFGKYKSFSGISSHMVKCGFTDSNQAKFVEKLYDENNASMIGCLESKKNEIATELLAEKGKEDLIKAARLSMKAADCESLTPILKDMCIILKR